jgi:hypothetical protein
MRKILICVALAALCGLGSLEAQRLRPGEQAIYLKTGDKILGRIADIVPGQLLLQLEDGVSIPFRDLWMINFVTEEWNFPAELNILETNDHYVFMKSGDISSGQISGLSKDKRAFLFESGDEFPIAQCRRIYFSKTVPRNLR